MSDENEDKSGEENTEGEDKNNDGSGTDNREEDKGGEGDDKEGEDDGKPLTKKELNKLLDARFANSRRDRKNSDRPYKSDSNKSGKGEGDDVNARVDAIELNNRKYDFGQEHGLSRKAVDLVFKFADGKPTAKTLEDPFVKGGLERLKTQSSLRDNTPDGSGSSGFEVDGKKWEEMKPEEKQKNFQAHQQYILKNKGKR